MQNKTPPDTVIYPSLLSFTHSCRLLFFSLVEGPQSFLFPVSFPRGGFKNKDLDLLIAAGRAFSKVSVTFEVTSARLSTYPAIILLRVRAGLGLSEDEMIDEQLRL